MTKNEESLKNFEQDLQNFGIEIFQIFSTQKYGPFDYLNEVNPSNKVEHELFMGKFKDGIYAIATSKNEALSLFHLDEDNNKELKLPKSIKFLIGQTKGSGEQTTLLAYIPKQYLNELKKALKLGENQRRYEMRMALKAHNSFYKNFFHRLYEVSQDYLENYFSDKSLKDLALNGNCKEQVPSQILEAIKHNKINPINRNFPIGEFEAHREEIELPNGQKKLAILTITTKFNGSNLKHFKKENYTVSETTDNYSIFYNLSTK